MGYVFECQGREVWSPSNRVALIFLAQVRPFEVQLNLPSGFTESMADTIEVNFQQLETFVLRMGVELNLDNTSIAKLLRGLCGHLLALLSVATALPADVAKLFPSEWITEAQLLAQRVMQVQPG